MESFEAILSQPQSGTYPALTVGVTSDSMLLNDSPYRDDSMKVVGYYMDLVNTKEVDEEVAKEISYDMNEEMNAVDIDDYEREDYEEDDDLANEANDNDNYFDE